MSSSSPPPARVRVTGPPRHASRRRPRARDIDEHTPLGTVLMGSLLRAQLRLALVTLTPLLAVAVGLPLLGYVAPGAAGVHLLGVPASWLVLGVGVYPLCFGLGWFYVRRAERHERQFTDLVGSDDERTAP